ncbi:MAG TPA: hypothetical protein DCG72_00075, partial [Gammaproteobacteria bacterium]|nr:hypothetical protein [Gammaproteobacteria bacterium]
MNQTIPPNTDPKKDNKPDRDHAMFDAELSGNVLNFQLLKRVLSWLVPYRLSLWVSGALVLVASFAAVLMEVVISRVLVDYIIVGDANSPMPDLGLIALTQQLEATFGLPALY